MLDAGEGIELVPAAARDADDYVALIEENRAALVRWMGWAETSRSREDVLAFIASDVACRADRSGFAFSLRVAGVLAGSIGLHDIVRLHAVGEVGYWLAARFQHRGIMTRAVERIARFALSEYELHRLELLAAVGNAPSRAVAERAGFTLEAILRERLRTPRGFEDCAVYARLAG